MRTPEYYAGRPVESLQTMLRTLADSNPRILPTIPDGHYGQNTYASVRSFQEYAGLAPSGTADLATWNKLVEAYDRALPQNTVPLISPVWPLHQIIRLGETNRHIYLVQAMLTALAHEFPELAAPALTGVLDATTSSGLRQIQAASELEENGSLDAATWNSLSALYRASVSNGKL